MDIQLDFRTKQPLYDQIQGEIRRKILEKQLMPGDQLPAVRDLAGALKINFNTVARAYRALDREGWISTQQGRGTYVLDQAVADKQPEEQRARQAGVEERPARVPSNQALVGEQPGGTPNKLAVVEEQPEDVLTDQALAELLEQFIVQVENLHIPASQVLAELARKWKERGTAPGKRSRQIPRRVFRKPAGINATVALRIPKKRTWKTIRIGRS